MLCCSLDIDTSASHPAKRRRVRHQHFWRNSDKLPPDHRLYVTSADIKQALEEVRHPACPASQPCSMGIASAPPAQGFHC